MEWRKATQRLSCVILLAVAALPLAAITPAPTAKTCDAVLQWARDNRETLPRDYRGLLAYPAGEQRAIYSNMSANEKAGYWTDRIGVYLEEHPELTAGQQRAIAEAQAFVKAEIFETPQKPGMPANEALARFSERMVASLGEKATQELFYGFDSAATGQRAAASGCECRGLNDCIRQSIPSDYCNNMEFCDQWVGCGFMLHLTCTGMCWFEDP